MMILVVAGIVILGGGFALGHFSGFAAGMDHCGRFHPDRCDCKP